MTAPGWYPDPSDPSRQRYFDGNVWTENYAPLAVPPVTPVSTPESGGNAIQKASEWWYGLSKKGRRIVIVSVAAVAIAIGWYEWATSMEQDPEYKRCVAQISQYDKSQQDLERTKAVCGYMWEKSREEKS